MTFGVLPLSDHARFEMERRDIPEPEIAAVFTHPQQKIVLAMGREIWQNRVILHGKEFVVRLVIEKEPEIRIVTVYRSSKVKKYWRAS